ncbi:MAG: hypothetical protein WC666_03375 [Candidatus Paceibacterota bacterium]|jgi:sulfur relay (sulfurtransferase) DsrF/TusC family protein
MIDFHKYIGENIVLVTNFVKAPEKIIGIRNKLSSIDIFSYRKHYVCARPLRESDLKDEDFIQWLVAMWPDEATLKLFKTNKKLWIEKESSPT